MYLHFHHTCTVYVPISLQHAFTYQIWWWLLFNSLEENEYSILLFTHDEQIKFTWITRETKKYTISLQMHAYINLVGCYYFPLKRVSKSWQQWLTSQHVNWFENTCDGRGHWCRHAWPCCCSTTCTSVNADQTGQAIRQRLIQRFAAQWLIHSCIYCYTQMYIHTHMQVNFG